MSNLETTIPKEESPVTEESEVVEDLPSFSLNSNLRQALKEYLGQRPYNEVSDLISGLDLAEVPGQVIIEISSLLQQERPVRLMQGLRMNIQQTRQTPSDE